MDKLLFTLVCFTLMVLYSGCGQAPVDSPKLDLSGWKAPVAQQPAPLSCQDPQYFCKGSWGVISPCCDPDQSS